MKICGISVLFFLGRIHRITQKYKSVLRQFLMLELVLSSLWKSVESAYSFFLRRIHRITQKYIFILTLLLMLEVLKVLCGNLWNQCALFFWQNSHKHTETQKKSQSNSGNLLLY